MTESKVFSGLRDNKMNMKVKDNKVMDAEDISQILVDLINRHRFNYRPRDILAYIFKCLCCRRKQTLRDSETNLKHFLFEKAEEKLESELDIITLLKSMRKLKLMT